MQTKAQRWSAALLNSAVLAIAALILLAIIGLSYKQWERYRFTHSVSIRTNQIVDTIDRLLFGLLDAEAGQRGFLLTGEGRYLDPYNRAIRSIPADLANLNRMLAESPKQADRVAQLNRLVEQKLAELRETIDLRRTQGLSLAVDIVLSDHGKIAMDQIRQISGDIRREEAAARIRISAETATAARGILLVTIIGSLFLLTFFVIGNVTINRAILARETALADAQNTRDSLNTTIASIGDAVISTDVRGRVVFANRVALSLLRARQDEVVGRHLDDVFRIINEFTRARVESPVTKVLRENTIVGLANHTVLIAGDGAEIPIDDSGAPIRDESGEIHGTVLVFRDITARRQAETTERLLASIVESSTDGIVSVSADGLVTSWNRGAARILPLADLPRAGSDGPGGSWAAQQADRGRTRHERGDGQAAPGPLDAEDAGRFARRSHPDGRKARCAGRQTGAGRRTVGSISPIPRYSPTFHK
jgi:PAS domain S-box-containing protein